MVDPLPLPPNEKPACQVEETSNLVMAAPETVELAEKEEEGIPVTEEQIDPNMWIVPEYMRFATFMNTRCDLNSSVKP